MEANRLLDLISNQRPAMKPKVCYWRAIALTHSRQFDQAAHELEQVLDPTGYAVHDPERHGLPAPTARTTLKWADNIGGNPATVEFTWLGCD